MVNVPVAAYTRGMDIRDIVEMMIPGWRNSPELIFISAGFDAHREDDMGQLGLTEQDYTWITQEAHQGRGAQTSGRIVSCLEGATSCGAVGPQCRPLRVLADI